MYFWGVFVIGGGGVVVVAAVVVSRMESDPRVIKPRGMARISSGKTTGSEAQSSCGQWCLAGAVLFLHSFFSLLHLNHLWCNPLPYCAVLLSGPHLSGLRLRGVRGGPRDPAADP